MTDSTIFYTHTDEAPALATASFLPIVKADHEPGGGGCRDAGHLARGRVLAAFPQKLTPEQQVGDALAELGGLATLPEANIIKLPNISASIPQLKAAIAELQAQGFDIPDYPDDAQTLEEKDIRARYDRIKGSAVNPVLREGNSDRRAPLSVKNYARKHPHRNKPFAEGSKTRVATLGHDDFKSNEKSVVIASDDVLTIQHVAADGTVTPAQDRPQGAARRDRRRDVPLGRRARRVPRRDAAGGGSRRHPLLGAPQGDDDEGQRPDHLRPRREGVLRRRVRQVRRQDRRSRPHPQRRPRRRSSPGLPSVEGGDEIAAAHHGRPQPRSAPVVHELRQGHHEPARPLGRHRGRLDARAHPQRRQAVGRRTAARTTRSPSSRTRRTRASSRRPSTT